MNGLILMNYSRIASIFIDITQESRSCSIFAKNNALIDQPIATNIYPKAKVRILQLEKYSRNILSYSILEYQVHFILRYSDQNTTDIPRIFAENICGYV